MERTIRIHRTQTEAGTSFGIPDHRFCIRSHTVVKRANTFFVDESSCSPDSVQPQTWLEASDTSAGVQYQLQTYGNFTFIVIVLEQKVADPKHLAPSRNNLEVWKQFVGSNPTHTGSDFPLIRHPFAPLLSERTKTLASPHNKLRNQISYGPAPTIFGKLENSVESMNFLSALARLQRAKKDRAAARYVYSRFYELRMAEDYPLCDRILRDVDVEKLTPTVLIAILTITAPIKQQLNHRIGFYERTKRVIERLRGPEVTKQLLTGLE